MSGGLPQARFVTERLVEFQHCDPAGIVFYPRYFEMLNSIIEEWFAARNNLPFREMHGPARRGVPTVQLSITFKAPSRLGDILRFELEVRKVGGSSVDLTTRCTEDGELRFSCDQTLVFMDLDTGRPKRWTDDLRARLTSQLTTQTEPEPAHDR